MKEVEYAIAKVLSKKETLLRRVGERSRLDIWEVCTSKAHAKRLMKMDYAPENRIDAKVFRIVKITTEVIE